LGQKTDAWEGGQRVPFIARWPGRFPAGTEGGQLLGLTDLMATLAAAADVAIPDDAAPDSINQLPVLIDPIHAPSVRTEFLIEGLNCVALRQGDYIYLPRQGSCGLSVPSETHSKWWSERRWWSSDLGFHNSDIDDAGGIKPNAPAVQLYNLATDPDQTII
jgi:arylsulfatase A-like enzyme